MAAAGEFAGMRSMHLLWVIALPTCVYSQTSRSARFTTVDKVCGTVVQTEVASTDRSNHSTTKPFDREVAVSLYHRSEKKKCCMVEQLAAQAQTDINGHFEFPNETAGEYWVVISVRKKTRKLAITLAPSADNRETGCSHFVYEIRNGDLRLNRMYRMG